MKSKTTLYFSFALIVLMVTGLACGGSGILAPQPTKTLAPGTATTVAKATTTAFACLNSAYVADVTVPDGSQFEGNAKFVKTWRVKNTGKCDWEKGIALAFQSGDKMDAPDAVKIGKAVKVGEQTEISVSMKSPSQAGRYRGEWRLQDATGKFFGERLTVVVVVKGSSQTDTPKSTGTPTPASDTPKKAAPTCKDMMSSKQTLSGAEWNSYLEGLKGSWVMGWRGSVLSVSEGGIGLLAPGYTVKIKATGDCEVLFTVSDKETALSYSEGQDVRITGQIDSFGDLFGFAIYLKDNPTISKER